MVDEQRARERGEEAGDREGHQRVAPRVHAVGAHRDLVLADGDEDAAAAGPSNAAHRDDREPERDQAQEVVPGLRADVDDAEEVGPLDPRRWKPVEAGTVTEELRVEQPRRRHQRERQRDHGDGETAAPQHREADERGDERADESGTEEPEPEVPAEPSGERSRHRGADPDERHLPEADLPGPPGEDHQRERDDGVDQRDRGEVGAALAQERREDDERGGDGHHERPAGPAHLGKAGQLTRDGARFSDGAPRGRFDPPAQAAARRREQQCREHDHEQHGLDVRALAPSPHHRLLDDPEADRRDHDRRETFHATDDGRGQRAEEDRRSEHGADRKTDDPCAEKNSEEREHGRDRPDERLEPPDRDPEQCGAVGVLGGPAHRDTHGGTEEEREQRTNERHGNRGDDLVAAEAHDADGEGRIDGRGKALRGSGHVEPAREQQPDPREQLREPDRRDAQDEAAARGRSGAPRGTRPQRRARSRRRSR